MFIALLLKISSSTGEYAMIAVDDDRVINAKERFEHFMWTIFPEFNRTNVQCRVKEAELQIVNGYNLRLSMDVGVYSIISEFSCISNSTNAKLTSITSKDSGDFGVGGFRILPVSEYNQEEISSIVRTLNESIHLQSIVMVRKQTLVGWKTHLVFWDEEDQLHSVASISTKFGHQKIVSYAIKR